MTRHHSFWILVCIVICSFFISNYTFNGIEKLDSVAFRVIDITEKNRFVTLTGDNITVNFFGESQGIKPGYIVKCDNLKVYNIKNRDYEKYLVARGILYSFSAKEVTVLEEKRDIYTISYDFRNFLSNKIERLYGEYSPMIKALIYGDRTQMDNKILDVFEKTGIVHILSLSGFHVGILILGLNIIFSKISIRKRAFIIFNILCFYIFVTGLKISVIRSCIFFGVYFLSFLYNRRYSLFDTACITASMFLVINPFLIYDKGFVLSYAGVISIAMFNILFRQYIPEEYREIYIIKIFITTISAQILILPITIYYFGVFPVSAFLVNLFAIPIITMIVILSIISIIISLFDFFHILKIVGHFIAGFVIFLQKILLFTVEEISNLKYSYLKLSISKETMIILYVIIIAVYILWERKIIKESINDTKRNTCKNT